MAVTVLSRGEVIIENGKLSAERGRGRFIARTLSEAAVPSGLKIPEMAQLDAKAVLDVPQLPSQCRDAAKAPLPHCGRGRGPRRRRGRVRVLG